MFIETHPFATAVSEKDLADKTVVVIDVLRATSVMITALHNGAKEIIPVLTKNEALREAKNCKQGTYLLCGERQAEKIRGFNLGNSPFEFSRQAVEGKTLIMTTTNGTKALQQCKRATEVFTAAFLNADAVAERIKHNSEVVLLCSGTNGRFSLDDGLCAGMIMDKLSGFTSIVADDLGHILWKNAQNTNENLRQSLMFCTHLNFLTEHGFEKDVDFCLQKNTYRTVPVYNPEKGKIYV